MGSSWPTTAHRGTSRARPNRAGTMTSSTSGTHSSGRTSRSWTPLVSSTA